MSITTTSLLLLAAWPAFAADVTLSSPGLPPSRMDAQGRLVEDWGSVGIRLTTDDAVAVPTVTVRSVKLDDQIPAAEARQLQGALDCALTAFRAPAFPGGLDVLTVTITETAGHETPCRLGLELPPNVRIGAKTVVQGGRPVITLPATPKVTQQTRDWGYQDDAVSLPGWAKPAVACDPAFGNIRAGLGGVPIAYRFKVEAKAGFNVVLGWCEGHWTQSGQRPVLCQVEGTAAMEVDPLARWGQHQPGGLTFAASDANGDGFLDLAVLPKAGAPDLNPILNVIWVFAAGPAPNLDRVILGQMNAQALYYVDVGGERDQPLESGGQVEYTLMLAPHGRQELTFLVACPGGSAPLPHQTAWTPDKLRRAAADVWRTWR